MPAIVDATSLQYVLHAAVGDVITIDADTVAAASPAHRRVARRLGAAGRDPDRRARVPRSCSRTSPGIACFWWPCPARRPSASTRSRGRSKTRSTHFGFDAQDTTRRLDAFHRVENTYLSTFQALGGLGLVLGCLGLVAVVARNVLERRRELALLGAAGFTGRDLQVLVASSTSRSLASDSRSASPPPLVAVAPVVMARGRRAAVARARLAHPRRGRRSAVRRPRDSQRPSPAPGPVLAQRIKTSGVFLRFT